MARRIGLWALAGLAVACFWVLFGFFLPRGVNFGMWPITSITAPASIIGRSAHFPVTWYEFILLNAALYSVVGLAIEPFRRLHR
jgi:hypothetical protein